MGNKPVVQRTMDLAQQPEAPAPTVSGAARDKLRKLGIDPEAINVSGVAFYVKVPWEELCTLSTRDPKTKASPLLTIVNLHWFPEALQEYKDYRGMVRVEFVTDDGDEQSVTHAMFYAADGSMLPLSEWLKSITLPCLARFGRSETRRQNQFVIRPLPWNIEIT